MFQPVVPVLSSCVLCPALKKIIRHLAATDGRLSREERAQRGALESNGVSDMRFIGTTTQMGGIERP